MAGKGPAPKSFDARRRANAPVRGDWVALAPLEKPTLPALPRGAWSSRTRAAWKAWSQDPATGMYGPADVSFALDTAYVYEQNVKSPAASLASEIRQRLDTLGLSPKGKQDRRWRVPPVVPERGKVDDAYLRPVKPRDLRAV